MRRIWPVEAKLRVVAESQCSAGVGGRGRSTAWVVNFPDDDVAVNHRSCR